jgi:hypothetical protein
LVQDRIDGREKEVRHDIDTSIQGNLRLARALIFHRGKRRAPKYNGNDKKASNENKNDLIDQQRSKWRTPARPKAKIITLEC